MNSKTKTALLASIPILLIAALSVTAFLVISANISKTTEICQNTLAETASLGNIYICSVVYSASTSALSYSVIFLTPVTIALASILFFAQSRLGAVEKELEELREKIGA